MLEINYTEEFRNNIVYKIYNNQECIYIGSSGNGLARIFASEHWAYGNRIEVIPCTTLLNARELEKRLIKDIKPNRNITNKSKVVYELRGNKRKQLIAKSLLGIDILPEKQTNNNEEYKIIQILQKAGIKNIDISKIIT